MPSPISTHLFRSERGAVTARILFLILAFAAVGAAGWFGGRTLYRKPEPGISAERKVLFYQSPMHPWIKSDKPGNCTICGMKLVPVYEGEAARDSSAETFVKLSPQSINVLQVETAPVLRQPLLRSLHVAGRIDDDDSTHRRLSAFVEGRIEKLHVPSVGAEVTEGQPLAALFSRELLVARGEYVLALKQPPSPDRENSIAGSRQKLRRFGLSPAQIDKLPEQSGDYIEILAPMSGTVVERKVYEGQYVKEGEVLFEIADFSRMWFVADVYERDLAWIRVGQMVEISTPTVPGKVYTAPIAFIDPNLTEMTRTARIRVVIDNPSAEDPAKHRHELLHRVYANGLIRVETPETLTVPRAAVLATGAEALVYVAKTEGVYEPRGVKLGRVGDDYYEVVDGLEEGEPVVINGNLLIDAQAQLNRGGQPATSEPQPSANMPPLTDAQREAARQFLAFADAVAARLFADDLAGFAEQAKESASGKAALLAAFPDDPLAKRVAAVSELKPAPDLPMARKAFQPLGDALVPWVAQLRKSDPAFADIKLYRCPMTADSFPGAPAKAAWMQLAPPIRNPYFGRAMPECGNEVKP
jgi:Cu(I)/Ag(I) efflux system membrane fusion protein